MSVERSRTSHPSTSGCEPGHPAVGARGQDGQVPPTTADEVLADLDPEQREVALALRGPVCVLAGAGTG
jgi:DNA helicase-2/ATP-dependent DNA helicase PcrA